MAEDRGLVKAITAITVVSAASVDSTVFVDGASLAEVPLNSNLGTVTVQLFDGELYVV